jgi:flagellar motor component MotA
MKNKFIGILIFLFFMTVPFLLEGGDLKKIILVSPLLIVFGPAIGLTVAHYKKGMEMQHILKKAKKYLIASGILGTLIGFISIFSIDATDVLTASAILRKVSGCLVSTLYGVLSAYIIDTFIQE